MAERNLLMIILRNFVNSFKPRQIRGTLVGEDNYGTKYYEIPADPSVGKRRAARWFEAVEKEEFQPEMPAEWESWLRGRRVDPPAVEEIMKNRAIMLLKQKNAAEIDAADLAARGSNNAVDVPRTGMESFPSYQEYEVKPGVVPKQKP